MDPVDNFVEIKLSTSDDFLKVKETLTRIGIASDHNKTLYQTCHILHKRQRYYIVHFKEMFALDGKRSTLTADDIARRNSIVAMLQKWNLVDVVNDQLIAAPVAPYGSVKVLPYSQKRNWDLVSKYQIGSS